MDDPVEVKGYRDLKVWQKSMDAADLVMDLIETGPLAKKYRLAGQWEASSASVPANISEGHELGRASSTSLICTTHEAHWRRR